jgi:hypothetical protein
MLSYWVTKVNCVINTINLRNYGFDNLIYEFTSCAVPLIEQDEYYSSEAVKLWQWCSYLVETRPHIEHTVQQQQPSITEIQQINENCILTNKLPSITTFHLQNGNMTKLITFATDLEGYSPFSLTSTHCFTLSSLSFGVAW